MEDGHIIISDLWCARAVGRIGTAMLAVNAVRLVSSSCALRSIGGGDA